MSRKEFRLYPPGSRKKNRYYVVRARIRGCEFERSTKATTKPKAIEFAEEMVTTIEKDLSEDVVEVTFAQAADYYLEAQRASQSQRGFVTKLKTILGAKQVGDVKSGDIHRAAQRLYPGRKASTLNRNAIAPAAAVLHYAAEQDWCPYRRIKRLKEAPPPQRRPKPGDPEKLLAKADGDLKKLLTVLYWQGCRLSEALSLTREQVNFRTGRLLFLVGKARAWKQVPMHPAVSEALKQGQWYGDRAFPWRVRHSVYERLEALYKRAGVRVTPHQFRHAFASEHGEDGATSKDLVAMSTWTNPRSTERYQAPSEEHSRRLLNSRTKKKMRAKPGENEVGS